jgi:hypothetical protein
MLQKKSKDINPEADATPQSQSEYIIIEILTLDEIM